MTSYLAQGISSIMSTFVQVQPNGMICAILSWQPDAFFNSGGTPTGAALKALLDIEIAKLDAAIGQPKYKAIKPLDIIVLTDGYVLPGCCRSVEYCH